MIQMRIIRNLDHLMNQYSQRRESFLNRRTALAVSCLFAVLVSFASARAGTVASLAGTVADPSGAVIPGVAVTIRNTETGAQQIATTNRDGFFAFPILPSGHYEIEMCHPGFKPYRRVGLSLDTNSALRVDATLELGPQKEAVTVSEAAVHVEAASTQMGEAVTGTKIASVPLNGRSFTDLLALQAGVVPITSQQPNAVIMTGVSSVSPSGDLNPGNLSISGQREFANGFSVNGSDVEEDVNMGTAVVPNLDSIAEFRILTNNFDAEYGNYSGGQIVVVTKSGGSRFHGDAFEFLRNTGLDARNFFSANRAQFNQNQFGGTLGGPLKHNKAFFFADYQHTGMRQGIDTGLIAVPSLEDRKGDLADLAGSLTGTVNGQYWADLLSQKLGYPVYPGERYYVVGCTAGSQCVFPGAQIPQRAWSAPAQRLLQYVPEPNASGNYFSTSGYDETLRDDKGALRLDGRTSLGMLSVYYFVDDFFLDNPYPTRQGGASVPGFNAVTPGRAQLASLSDTKTFGASAVNEFHFSFMRDATTAGQPFGGVGPSLASQGFVTGPGTPGIVPLDLKIEGVENVSLNDYTFGVDISGLRQANDTFQLADNFAKVVGTHTLKAGAEFHYDEVNVNPENGNYNGSFAFRGSESGSDLADFLMGIASSYSQVDTQAFYNRNRYIGLYGQDSWRARPNLTLNYGLRWDLISPWSEKYDQLQTLVLGEPSRVYLGAPAGLVFPGDPGVPSTLAPTKHNSLAPRLGIAWSPSAQRGLAGKILGGPGGTSIRAGYGLFYTAFEGLSAGIMSANPPFGYDYTSFAPVLFSEPFIIAASGQNIGQRFPLSFPGFGASTSHPDANIDWSPYLPITGVPSFYRGNEPPYAENVMFSIERRIRKSTLLSASYVGTQAHHLLVLISANPGNPALCLSLSQPSEVMPGTPTCGPFGEDATYTTLAGKVIQGTRSPFSSQFAAVTYQKTIGNSSYNALEISLRHESGRLQLLLGYTCSKSLDQSSSLGDPVNPVNPQLSRALSAFDMRHNFVASYKYNLPTESLFRGRNRWTEGWSLSGITRFSTGLPVTLYNNNDSSLLGSIPNGINNNGVDTPNYIPGPLELNTDPRNGKPAFNTALFSLPALGQMGTAARRFFSGPGIENFDLALLKHLRLTESKSLEFRAEAFNVFNHAQFYGPAVVNGNISSPAFGQIVSAASPRILQVAAKFHF